MVVFVIAAIVGVIIGVFSGLLGVGGGAIMIPVFRLAFGLAPVASTGTSLFTIIPTSVSGVVGHVRNGTCVVKLGFLMGVGGALTSPLGVWLAQASPGWLVMTATALVIGYSAFSMLRKALMAPKGRARKARRTATEDVAGRLRKSHREASGDDARQARDDRPSAAEGPAQPIESFRFDVTPASVIKALFAGVVTGVASGYVGLGGGFIMIPLIMAFYGLPMRLASGTSLIAVMILALPGAVTQCVFGNVDYLIGIATACGTIPGAFLGARLVPHVPERTLRFVFSAFLAVAALLLVVRETGVLG